MLAIACPVRSIACEQPAMHWLTPAATPDWIDFTSASMAHENMFGKFGAGTLQFRRRHN